MKKYILLLIIPLLSFGQSNRKFNNFYQQGLELKKEKKYEQAIKNFNAAFQINKHSWEAALNIALIYGYDLKKYPQALEFVEMGLVLQPKNALFYRLRADIYLIQEK